jgi:hypothetical protein
VYNIIKRKLSRTNYKTSTHVSSNETLENVTKSVPRLRGSGPREDTADWSLVKNDKKKDTLELNASSKVSRPRGRPPRSVV